MYIEYLDFPEVTDHMARESAKLLGNHFSGKSNNYTIHWCEKQLQEYLQTIFPDKKKFRYQVLQKGVPVHIDKGRTECYNYILEAGGKNVETVWYKNDIEVYRTCIPEKKWHKLNVSVGHTVENIETERFAITVN
jgi:hypothetical protein